MTERPAPAAERWQRLEQLFHQALALPPGERSAFLQRTCDDDGLRREVERMLVSDEGSADYLAALRDEVVAPVEAAEHEAFEQPGQRVGAFELVRCLGRGGMGSVWLAERTDEFRQRVAVKLVRRGLDTGEILQRFRQERQLLAGLEHPHIARLVDGGATPDGRPYLVMEAVEGKPIDTWCDEQRLDIAARLRLFVKVCAAVQHAHGHLVVHRDLKPGNILVTEEGEPKLLDFGIAKVLDGGADSGDVTDTLQRRMTPQYASPEQLSGLPLSLASDVYSLGALLYELLTGHRPYELAGRTPQERERLITHDEPRRPSTVVTQSMTRPVADGTTRTTSAADLGHARADEPGRLKRRLSGDLDTIVLMALRKEPERRYASVEQFAEDIRRHLEGLPVRARADTLGYRSAKFVRRHRLLVASATLVFAVLVTAIVLISQQVEIAQAERAKADDAADAAQRAANEAEQRLVETRQALSTAQGANEFLMNILMEAEPRRSGPGVTVRQAVDAVARPMDETTLDPWVEASVRGALGGTLRALGDLSAAEGNLERALQLALDTHGESHITTLFALHELGVLRRDQARLDEAAELLARAAAGRRRLLGRDHVVTASSIGIQGIIAVDQARYDEAAPWLAEALAIREELQGLHHPDTLVARKQLAALKLHAQALDEAEVLLRDVLAAQREQLGDDHVDTLITTSDLGLCLGRIGEFDESERLLALAAAGTRDALGPGHMDSIVTGYNHARALMRVGRREEALEAFAFQLGASLNSLPAGHPITTQIHTHLADILRVQGRFEELDALARQVEAAEAAKAGSAPGDGD